MCGSGTTNTGGPVDDFLYYFEGQTIKAATLSGGTLAPVNAFTSPALGQGSRNDMTIVNKKFLYEPWIPSGGVVAIQGFSINRTGGGLTPVPGNPVPTTTPEGDSIASDPQGRFLFVGDRGTAQISVFVIDGTTGALTPAATSPIQVLGSTFSQLTVDGTGTYLYAADSGTIFGVVQGFTIDQFTGNLTPIPGSPFAAGLYYVQAEASGKFLLGLDLAGGITVLPIQQGTGILLPGSNYSTVSSPFMFAVHPSGSFVYTFALDQKNKPLPVEGFLLDTNGVLTPLTGSPFTTLPGIIPAKFDQDGTSLFGLLAGGSIQVFGVDPTTGALSGNVPPLQTVAGPFAPTN